MRAFAYCYCTLLAVITPLLPYLPRHAMHAAYIALRRFALRRRHATTLTMTT